MPDFGWTVDRNLSPLIAAWTAHYIAKGASPVKARAVAQKRCQRKTSWPRLDSASSSSYPVAMETFHQSRLSRAGTATL